MNDSFHIDPGDPPSGMRLPEANISNSVPHDLDGLLIHIDALREANKAFRGGSNETFEHIGFMVQKILIVQTRIVEFLNCT